MAVPTPQAPHLQLLAFADELLAEPHLLAGFGATFGGDEEVSLVVHCPPERPGLLEALEASVIAAGLEGEDSPAVVVAAVADDEANRVALAASSDLLYSRRPPTREHAHLRRVDDLRPELLRAIAESTWGRPSRPTVAPAERRPPAPRPAAPPSAPSFLLLTLDSCRYDVLCDARTPVLDRFASEILPAQTPANFTYAAHHAFFAGMLPHVGESRPYYNRFVRQLIGLAKVGEGELVAERALKVVPSTGNFVSGLREAGYQTVGAGAMNWFQQDALTCWFERFAFTDVDADAQIEFVLRELDVARPFFAFVNFGETHDPFEYRGKQTRCSYRVQSRLMSWPPREDKPSGRDSEAYWHQVEAVEFLDRKLERLFEALPGETIAIVCGDHGEAFGEDGYWGHAVNHPKVHEVPLAIFRLDGRPLEQP